MATKRKKRTTTIGGVETVIEDVGLFWRFCLERHAIWHRRFKLEQPPPWTLDPTMRKWKFTNVFRELDRGTIALRKMIGGHHHRSELPLICFNVLWYRMLNRAEHATALGWISRDGVGRLKRYIARLQKAKKPVCTSAHQVHLGSVGALRAIEHWWKHRYEFAAEIQTWQSMEHAYCIAQQCPSVGPFVAYEFAKDMRWEFVWDQSNTRGLKPIDVDAFCSIGPGSGRGLNRLGFSATPDAMRELWISTPNDVGRKLLHGHIHPWELECVEHALCEFDKWCRTVAGEGRPRLPYRGPSAVAGL